MEMLSLTRSSVDMCLREGSTTFALPLSLSTVCCEPRRDVGQGTWLEPVSGRAGIVIFVWDVAKGGERTRGGSAEGVVYM